MNKENLNSNNKTLENANLSKMKKSGINSKVQIDKKKIDKNQMTLKRYYSSYKKETISVIGKTKYASLINLIDSLFNKYEQKKKWKLEFCEYFENERVLDFRSKDYFPKSLSSVGSYILSIEKFWILWLEIIKKELNIEELVDFTNKAINYIDTTEPILFIEKYNNVIHSLAIPDEDVKSICNKIGKDYKENGNYDYLLNINLRKNEKTGSKFKRLNFEKDNNVLNDVTEYEEINYKILTPEIATKIKNEDISFGKNISKIEYNLIENYDEDIKSIKCSLEKIKKSIIANYTDKIDENVYVNIVDEIEARELSFENSNILKNYKNINQQINLVDELCSVDIEEFVEEKKYEINFSKIIENNKEKANKLNEKFVEDKKKEEMISKVTIKSKKNFTNKQSLKKVIISQLNNSDEYPLIDISDLKEENENISEICNENIIDEIERDKKIAANKRSRKRKTKSKNKN